MIVDFKGDHNKILEKSSIKLLFLDTIKAYHTINVDMYGKL